MLKYRYIVMVLSFGYRRMNEFLTDVKASSQEFFKKIVLIVLIIAFSSIVSVHKIS